MVEFYDPIAKQNITYHLDAKLVKMWDNIRDGKLEKINEDRVYLIDGRERTGKSSFAFQQAKYIDPTFTTDRICFEPDDFLDRIRNAPKGSVVVFDEAFRGLSSKSSRSKVNKAIVEALMEVGQRNLVIFIVLPTLFLLEIYAAVFRSECLFHVYKMKKKKDKESRIRAFKIYNYVKKRTLYLRGRAKYFSYAQPKIRRAKGQFYVKKNEQWKTGIPYETFDQEAYLKKKEIAYRKGGESKEDEKSNKYMLLWYKMIDAFRKELKLSEKKTADKLNSYGIEISSEMVGKISRSLAETNDNSLEEPGLIAV